MSYKPTILVSGEPNSIFFEILFKALNKKIYKNPIILICSKKILFKQIKKFDFKKKLNLLTKKNIISKKFDSKKLNIIDIEFDNLSNKFDDHNLIRSFINNSFNVAFKLIKNGVSNKLINGPIDKKVFLNKKFLGVTEFIANQYRKTKVGMLIYNEELSVCPLTTHLPLKLVSKKISRKLLSEKIDLIVNFFKTVLKIKAKIAVTCLNPHCESILKFNEDKEKISKIIKNKQKKKINIKGPFSADTIFLKNNRRKFNVILGMYHDQVIGPFKTIYEYDGINITMGLPILRISPDHGPNKKMVGKNISNPKSLIKALDFLEKR